MKTRFDFVSNSSSSSFVVFGMDFDINEFITKVSECKSNTVLAAIEKLNKDKYSSKTPADIAQEVLEENFDYDEFVVDNDTEYACVGFSLKKMKDDETLLQFKARISQKLQDIGITDAAVPKINLITGVTDHGGYFCPNC